MKSGKPAHDIELQCLKDMRMVMPEKKIEYVIWNYVLVYRVGCDFSVPDQWLVEFQSNFNLRGSNTK